MNGWYVGVLLINRELIRSNIISGEETINDLMNNSFDYSLNDGYLDDILTEDSKLNDNIYNDLLDVERTYNSLVINNVITKNEILSLKYILLGRESKNSI